MFANVMAMGSSGIGSEIQSGRTECQGRFCDRREAGLLLPIAVVGGSFYLLNSNFSSPISKVVLSPFCINFIPKSNGSFAFFPLNDT